MANAHLHDESSESFKVKKRALAGKNLTIVAPNDWMLRHARNSAMFAPGTDFRKIKYGLDLDVYRPLDKAVARRQLGLDPNTFIVGFGAEDINHHRKGVSYLIESLSLMDKSLDMQCLIFGGGELSSAESSQLPEVNSLGFIESPAKKALAYSAMDCFVLPSLEDNSPQTCIEAMACGTPVTGFATGGISELVRDNQNGILSKVCDTRHLAATLEHLVNHPELVRHMSVSARKYAMANHSSHQQAYKYLQLYQEVLGVQQSGMTKNKAATHAAA